MSGKGKKAPKSGGKRKGAARRGRRAPRTFARFLFRLVRSKKVGVSSKGMAVLNSFVNHMIAGIGAEAGALANGRTMKAAGVAAATRFAVPGELGRKAASAAGTSCSKFAGK